jgi:hypothetical protein
MAVVFTEEPSVSLLGLQPLWHEKTPRRLVENCPANDPFAGWQVWQEHLRARGKPVTPRFLKKKNAPILWCWLADWRSEAVRASLESPATLAEIAFDDDVPATPDLPLALQLVSLAYALPALAQELPADKWWFLAERLHTAATIALPQHVDWLADPAAFVRSQLLAGELPLALGLLFPEVRALRALRDDARTTLSEALIEVTDGEGLPHARLLPVIGPLFACWTRCRILGQRVRRGAWSRPAEKQYQWLVTRALRLADEDGTFMLSSTGAPRANASTIAKSEWCKSLFKSALQLAGDRGDRAAAAVALQRGVVAKSKRFSRRDLPKPSLNSDWAGVTVMADGWSQSAARLAVAYTDEPPTIELSVCGERLLEGRWKFSTVCDGQAVQATGEWEQLCWESGKRFDFLELGLKLTSGLRLERQLLFARDEQVVYLADIIASSDGVPRHLQHTLELPLASGLTWNAKTETRDGAISGNKVRAAVLPLALREWRADPRGGSLLEKDGRLVLSQENDGRAVCCPLMIDLKRKRSNKERTWRQLTVGESMEVVPSDIAVGFRARSGDDQWLFYRSLGPTGNRTVLGQNIAGEFCAGRLLPTGKFKEWVEIEAV